MTTVYHKAFNPKNIASSDDAELYDTDPPDIEEIRVWEQEHSTKIPKDYIRFLMKYNGGYLFPQSFDHNVDDPSEFVTPDEIAALNNLFNWELFKYWNRESHVRRDKMISIGFDYNGGEICISIEEHNFGQILYWWTALTAAWDVEEDGPYPVGVIANNFREFIFEKLFDEDGSAPRWYIPKDLETANIVEF